MGTSRCSTGATSTSSGGGVPAAWVPFEQPTEKSSAAAKIPTANQVIIRCFKFVALHSLMQTAIRRDSEKWRWCESPRRQFAWFKSPVAVEAQASYYFASSLPQWGGPGVLTWCNDALPKAHTLSTEFAAADRRSIRFRPQSALDRKPASFPQPRYLDPPR